MREVHHALPADTALHLELPPFLNDAGVIIPASSHLFVDDHTEIRTAQTPQQVSRDLNALIEIQKNTMFKPILPRLSF